MASKFFSLLFILLAASSNVAFAADYSDELYQAWKTSVGSRIDESLKATRNSGKFKIKITQNDLAAHLQVSQSRVSKIVSGTQPISLMQGFEVAKFLEVDPGWLLDFQLIRSSIAEGEFPITKSTKGMDFFFTVIQFAMGRVSESDSIMVNSCERSLSSYSSEELVEELRARGWSVNLSR